MEGADGAGMYGLCMCKIECGWINSEVQRLFFSSPLLRHPPRRPGFPMSTAAFWDGGEDEITF